MKVIYHVEGREKIMKKRRGKLMLIIALVFIAMFIPHIISNGEFLNGKNVISSNKQYKQFNNFNPNAKLGTEENPFIILEIVPYRGMGQIGYVIGGQEPVDPSLANSENLIIDQFNNFAGDAFEVKTIQKEILDASDKIEDWEWKKSEEPNHNGYFQKVTDSTGNYNLVQVEEPFFFEKKKEGGGEYIWVEEENSENIPTDYSLDLVWMEENYTLDTSYWEKVGNGLLQNKEFFKREVLNLSKELIENYQIRVVTITPDELNKNVEKFSKYYDLSNKGKNNKVLTKENGDGEIDLIGNADFISISLDAQEHTRELIDFWEEYGRDKSGLSSATGRYTMNFGDQDFNWQTTMELFMKAGVVEDIAPIVYDMNSFINPPSNTSSKSKLNNTISGQPYFGNSNNVYKLILLLRQRNPLEFYNLYFNTNGGEITPLVTTETIDGRTTGKFNVEVKNELDTKLFWNEYTFCPPYPDGTYPNNINKEEYKEYLNKLGFIIGESDYSGQCLDGVIRNTYSYNGESSIIKYFVSLDDKVAIKEPKNTRYHYNTEFFDYLVKKEGGARPGKASPSMAFEYILNRQRPDWNGKKEVTILDLEPSNEFTLTVQDIRYMVPTYSGIIKIKQQTTAEFIGKIEDLNNTYDMIFIGTKTGTMNTVMENKKLKTVYNDPMLDGLIYTHVGDRVIGYDSFKGILKNDNRVVKAMDSINFSDSSFNTSKIFKGYNGMFNKNIRDYYDYSKWKWIYKSEFDKMMETADFYRYSGNDITSIKRLDLEEYVDGGFPVLLEDDLYQCNKSIIDDSSHLYDFLLDNKNNSKLINKKELTENSDQYYTTQKNLTKLLARERLAVDLTQSPIEFDVNNKSTLIEDRTLRYEFTISPPTESNSEDLYKWNIYVDANADGRFVGKEIVLTDTTKAGISISRVKRLSEKYAGVIPWKLEVISNNNPNIRTGKSGFAAFKVKSINEFEKEKTQINILQITSNSSTLNLQELMNPSSGKTSLFYKYTSNLDDFNVNITTINVNEFVNKYKGFGNRYDVNKPEETDKIYFTKDGEKVPYDMLIFGFGDCYSDITNDNGALNNVQAFIDSGRSVLFTHDTTSFVNLKSNEYDRLNTGLANWGYGFNQYLRNRVGLDRFGVMREAGDTTPYDTGAMPSKVASSIYKNGTNQYPELQGITYGILVAYSNPNGINEIYNANKKYPPFSTGNNIVDGNAMSQYHSYKVSKVNEGQITNYPYEIPDDFNTTQTHTQYYQLNMDDPEIVVWYALSDDKGNGPYSTSPNDVRNNYYIYSKDNIMYTGVGHASIDKLVNKGAADGGNANEVKLFINTMIASYNAGVTAPEVQITNEDAIQNSAKEYTLYEDIERFADLSGTTRRIKFIGDDKNLLSSKQIVRIYYYDNYDNLVLKNPVVKAMDGNVAFPYTGEENGYYINNGKEYYFDFPLNSFATKGNDKFLITVTNEDNLKGNTKGIIIGRSLFDLD